jgi:hypothetical protein
MDFTYLDLCLISIISTFVTFFINAIGIGAYFDVEGQSDIMEWFGSFYYVCGWVIFVPATLASIVLAVAFGALHLKQALGW